MGNGSSENETLKAGTVWLKQTLAKEKPQT